MWKADRTVALGYVKGSFLRRRSTAQEVCVSIALLAVSVSLGVGVDDSV